MTKFDNSRAKAVWDEYFNLIFNTYNLLNKLNKYISNEKHVDEGFYRYVRQGDEVDKDRLLKLLTCDPREPSVREMPHTEQEVTAIQEIFKYDTLTGHYHDELAKFIQMLGVEVCPYCGRSFTTTIQLRKGGIVRTNQVDHFYPKSKYPWLALSIWNMIPVCGYCNHRKSDDEESIPYPYAEGMGDNHRFRTHPTTGVGYLVGARDSEDEFEVRLEVVKPYDDKELEGRARNEIDMLHLEELYATHNTYVSEIFRQRYVFGSPYIDTLVSSLPDLFHSREDVLAMLSLRHIDAESIGGMPLDKLTRDIHHEIDELTGERFVR